MFMMRASCSWLTIWVLYTHLSLCFARLAGFSQALDVSGSIITSAQGITIGACARECESRARCRSALYYRLMNYCVLTSLARDEQPDKTEVGAILLSEFHPATKSDIHVDCNGTICSDVETCTTQSQDSRVCKLTECDAPVADHSEFLGNLYTVGSRQVDSCSYRDDQITCDQSGQWLPRENLVVHDCNDVCGTSGVYMTSGLQVYCDMDTDEGHWLVFQRRQDGSENFERYWSDYRDGFGSLQGEFWLGLELLHRILSNGEYELRIDLEDWDGIKKFAKYSSFSINNEADNYRLSVSGYSGDAGNAFWMNGYMFSTLDRDNDVHRRSCAEMFRGGWWYAACHGSNLNGLYHVGGDTTVYAKTVVWNPWHGHYYSMKTAEMKIDESEKGMMSIIHRLNQLK